VEKMVKRYHPLHFNSGHVKIIGKVPDIFIGYKTMAELPLPKPVHHLCTQGFVHGLHILVPKKKSLPQLNWRRAGLKENYFGSRLVCLTIVKAGVKLFRCRGVVYEDYQVFGFWV
jgi:hypothetical protein